MKSRLCALCLCFLGIFTGCGEKSAPAAPVVAPIVQLSSADVVQVRQGTVNEVVPITGSLTAYRSTVIGAQSDGVVTELKVRVGDAVRAGQVLARLDAVTLREKMREQDAQLATSRAHLDLARKKLDKQRELFEQNFISRLAFDELVSDFNVKQTELAAKSAQLAQARKALSDSTVIAPFAGVIFERAVDLGQSVVVNTKLFGLANLDILELEANVPSALIGRVHVGQAAQFRVEGSRMQFTGKVVRQSPVANSGTRSFTVYIRVDNHEGRLRAGQFAEGDLIIHALENTHWLPPSAIRDRHSGAPYVLTVLDGHVLRQAVRLSLVNESEQRVAVSDIPLGATVILANVLGVQAGDRVQVNRAQ